MSRITIGGREWDFVDSEGEEAARGAPRLSTGEWLLTPNQKVRGVWAEDGITAGRWLVTPDLRELRPPTRGGSMVGPSYWNHTMAIAVDQCLAEETIECKYQIPADSGNFGIVFAAQDSGHYYWAYIPHWGNLWRARAFYAAIGKADGSGYIRNLKMQLMPNVVCHLNVWRSIKVERRGGRIQMWVGGVKGPCVSDDTYGPGRVGIAGFSKYLVRNLKIDGQPVAGPAWKPGDQRGRPWFHLDPDPNLGDIQAWMPVPLVRFPDGEIVMAIWIGRNSYCQGFSADNSAVHLYRSRDGGRSWSRYGVAGHGMPGMAGIPGGTWFLAGPDRIRCMYAEPERGEPSFTIVYRDSTDKGLTWSEPAHARLLGDWSGDLFRPKTTNAFLGWPARLRDGTLLHVINHGYKDLYAAVPNEGQGTWGTTLMQPYCTLSTDNGESWSEPAAMDNAASNDGDQPDGPHGGFSETTAAQLPSERIVALARPVRSPYMWQTQSDDGGKSWRMACYAPFSGAGNPRLVVTRSGYLVVIKRGPGVGLHMSTDGGLNWDEGTMIDWPSSFNGSVLEVEPDVLLVVYPESMDELRPSYVRAQLIRITAEGPVPVVRGEAR